MQYGIHRQCLRQLQGILDRAGRQRVVLQGIDAAVSAEQVRDLAWMLGPELAERALRTGKGAMQQHQHRFASDNAGRGYRGALEWVKRPWVERVEPRDNLLVDPFRCLPGDRVCNSILANPGNDLDQLHQHHTYRST
ncbi:hypothetical protein D3C76_1100950 [compost metagenome]